METRVQAIALADVQNWIGGKNLKKDLEKKAKKLLVEEYEKNREEAIEWLQEKGFITQDKVTRRRPKFTEEDEYQIELFIKEGEKAFRSARTFGDPVVEIIR
jgi:hypothetical protein